MREKADVSGDERVQELERLRKIKEKSNQQKRLSIWDQLRNEKQETYHIATLQEEKEKANKFDGKPKDSGAEQPRNKATKGKQAGSVADRPPIRKVPQKKPIRRRL